MSKRNASSSAFGWDFQANSAILLMLENIKEAKRIRVEGDDEDIEITLYDNSKIYAQVKSVEKPDDTSNVISKLTQALETLSDAARKGDGSMFTYITNSPNPFNNQQTMSFFTGRTHLKYDELPETAKKRIDGIIHNKGYEHLDVHKIDIRVIPFYGDDPKNRFKEIQACVNEFLAEVSVDGYDINTRIMGIWQRDLFHNATQSDTSISISKRKMIWPLIVLVVDKVAANEYKKDFNDDEVNEVERQYKLIINQHTLSYDMITRVLTDYRRSRKTRKHFVADCWTDYLDIVGMLDVDENIKESLIKIVLYRILVQAKQIQDIKRGTNL